MATDDRPRSPPLSPYTWRLATIAVLMLVAAAGYVLTYFLLVDTSAPCPPGPGLLGITRLGAGLLGLVTLVALPLGVLFLTYAQERARPRRARKGLRVTREGPSAWMVQAVTAASLAPWSGVAGFIVAGIASGWLGDQTSRGGGLNFISYALLGLLAALCVAIASALIACRLLFALHARRCARIADPAPRKRCPECGVDYESARAALPLGYERWRSKLLAAVSVIMVIFVALMTVAKPTTPAAPLYVSSPESSYYTFIGWPINWMYISATVMDQSAIDDPASGVTPYGKFPPWVQWNEFSWFSIVIHPARLCPSNQASSIALHLHYLLAVIALIWMFVAVVGLSCDAVMGYIAGRRLLRGGCPSCGYPVHASAPAQGHG